MWTCPNCYFNVKVTFLMSRHLKSYPEFCLIWRHWNLIVNFISCEHIWNLVVNLVSCEHISSALMNWILSHVNMLILCQCEIYLICTHWNLIVIFISCECIWNLIKWILPHVNMSVNVILVWKFSHVNTFEITLWVLSHVNIFENVISFESITILCECYLMWRYICEYYA